MKLFTETMMDRPEDRVVVGSASYWLFSFIAIPFLLHLLMIGSYDNFEILAGGQLVYHVVNFLAVLILFWGYLWDSFLNVEVETSRLIRNVASSAALVLVIFIVWQTLAPVIGNSFVRTMAWGTLPIGEMDTLVFSPDVIYFYPLWGSLVMILLTPVTTSCIYYAMTFAPFCNNKPWLAYLMVSLILAIPRVINSMMFYPAEQELAIYLAQLPIHLVACRAYQKCDTVWAPIFTLMVANLFACVYMGLPSLLLGLLK